MHRQDLYFYGIAMCYLRKKMPDAGMTAAKPIEPVGILVGILVKLSGQKAAVFFILR